MIRPTSGRLAGFWTRRAAAGLLAGAAALLAGCGSGSVVSDLHAERFIVVGDGFSDVGQNGHRYTVNDGSLNWIQQLAEYYELTIKPATEGGWGYAQGHARVALPDTRSGTDAPSVTAQIDALLARTTLDAQGDVVFINGGVSDIVAAVEAHGDTPAAEEAVNTAAQALAEQVKRVVEAGARHVVVTGVPNICHTPWARALGLEADYEDCAPAWAFNSRLLVELNGMGATTLYFDAALFYNLIYNKPSNYPVDNIEDAVCTTPDASTCTPGTVKQTDYNRYLFADALHYTPAMQRLFVDRDYVENAYTRFRERW